MGFFDWFKKKPKAASQAVEQIIPPAVNQQHKPPAHTPSEALLAHAKPAWLWHMADGEGDIRATRTGGRPVMGLNETWPECQSCNRPLSFMMQCDLDSLPTDADDHGGGIIRQFYCEDDACVGMGGWSAFDPQHHLSILRTPGDLHEVPDNTKTFTPRHVIRWEKVDDIPHWADQSDIGIDEEACARTGHKFAGWPHWIQGAERPACPECNTVMQPFIQLDEDHERAFNFGGGIGHISQCPTHRDQVAFGWACG